MPWIKGNKDNPDYYQVPLAEAAVSFNRADIEYAKSKRADVSNCQQEVSAAKRESENMKDYETAKFYRSFFSDLMLQFRGWDFCIKWMEGDQPKDASEQTSPFIDRSFSELVFCEREYI